MHRTLSLTLLIAGAMAGTGLVPRSSAQDTPVYHCIGAHGEPVFSGQPCGVLRLPSTRIDAAVPETTVVSDSHGFCAVDAEELRTRAIAAIDAHDANRLAALFLWEGMDGATARARLRELAAVVDGSVLDLQIEAATPAPAGSASTPSADGATALLIRRAGAPWNAASPEETRYPLLQRDGCWWLRF